MKCLYIYFLYFLCFLFHFLFVCIWWWLSTYFVNKRKPKKGMWKKAKNSSIKQTLKHTTTYIHQIYLLHSLHTGSAYFCIFINETWTEMRKKKVTETEAEAETATATKWTCFFNFAQEMISYLKFFFFYNFCQIFF